MKIKCNDGIVRRFSPAHDHRIWGLVESSCLECGEELGCNDTRIAKKFWKEHICKGEKE